MSLRRHGQADKNLDSKRVKSGDKCAQGVKRLPRFGGMFVQRHGSAVVVVGNNPAKGSNLSAFSTKNPNKMMVMHRYVFLVLLQLSALNLSLQADLPKTALGFHRPQNHALQQSYLMFSFACSATLLM